MARRTTGKGKPRPVSYGYWREAANAVIHGDPHAKCAGGRELFPCRLTWEQFDAAARCECAVWWGAVPAQPVALFGLGLVNVPLEASAGSGVWSFAVERSGELAVVWASYNVATDTLTVRAPADGGCFICGAVLVDGEGGEESVEAEDGVKWCHRCARPALSISYGSTVVARVEGPAEVERTATASAVCLSDGAIAWARQYKRRMVASGGSCPLCSKVGRTCLCTPRELAEFRARQGVLPGIDEHIAPAMPAAREGQGRLF